MVSEEIMEYHKEPFRTEKTFPKQENAINVPAVPTGIRKEIPAGKKLRVRSAKAGMDAFFLLLEKENACALNAEDCREVHFVGCLRAIEPSGSGENHEL